ncbi:MAG TPA: hypothetical protein VJ583_05915 [Nitrososphaeraceae archaeon]|nr:hypothetical protein [Nitrososphaeraceae archaeon]
MIGNPFPYRQNDSYDKSFLTIAIETIVVNIIKYQDAFRSEISILFVN